VSSVVAVGVGTLTVGNVPIGVWTPVSLDGSNAGDKLTATATIPGASMSKAVSPDGGFPPFGATDVDIGLTFTFGGGTFTVAGSTFTDDAMIYTDCARTAAPVGQPAATDDDS